ncbi:hypothetical protein AVEN_99309-1 [Araneus ventricosus]|uniref:Uncharacterized protein n=1 Tax=Araneus ventricosus TaxID=182803 RepID=A0A4Y2INS6_ARAVE|nr:hypothetical protein AVEN_99309-1 [Araneus ventricosus]
MQNIEVEEISKVSESSEHKTPYIKSVDGEGKSENIISTPSTEISMDSTITESAEQDSCIKVSDFVNNDSSTVESYKSSVNEAVVSEEISKLISDTCDTVQIIVNDKSSASDVYKPSVNGIVVSEEISDTCDTVKIIVNDKSSTSDVYKPSVNEIVVSEEISKLISDTCNTVEIIVS